MKVAIPKERRAYESRVATTPDAIKRMKPLGLTFLVEAGAGLTAAIPDQAFVDAGAEIVADNAALLGQADIVLKVARPLTAAEANGADELAAIKPGTVLISQLDPYRNREQVADYAKRGIVAVAMELVPRITRAQSMDVLSSQANLAGYKAVIDAAEQFGVLASPACKPSPPRAVWGPSSPRPTCAWPPRNKWKASARPSSSSTTRKRARPKLRAATPRKCPMRIKPSKRP